jgi:5-amino-6-(5-phospho-D-ribitylamino)uracil phosphatase
MKTYFLTDLDGTLLRSNATLSPFSVSVLKDALSKGAVISYATARSYQSSNQVVSEIPWKYPIVLYNGAMIFDPVHKKVIGGHWLSTEITNGIITLAKKKDLTPFLFSLDSENQERVLHEKLHRVGDLEFYNSRTNDPRFKEMLVLLSPVTYRTLIITFIGFFEELEVLRNLVIAAYGDMVHIHFMKDSYIKDHYFLEFSHPKANKQEGLNTWADLVGCQSADVTVLGDQLNDRGMFLAAGIKIAVANAHPQILEMADQITASNDEDGVANYISEQLTKSNK